MYSLEPKNSRVLTLVLWCTFLFLTFNLSFSDQIEKSDKQKNHWYSNEQIKISEVIQRQVQKLNHIKFANLRDKYYTSCKKLLLQCRQYLDFEKRDKTAKTNAQFEDQILNFIGINKSMSNMSESQLKALSSQNMSSWSLLQKVYEKIQIAVQNKKEDQSYWDLTKSFFGKVMEFGQAVRSSDVQKKCDSLINQIENKIKKQQQLIELKDKSKQQNKQEKRQ